MREAERVIIHEKKRGMQENQDEKRKRGCSDGNTRSCGLRLTMAIRPSHWTCICRHAAIGCHPFHFLISVPRHPFPLLHPIPSHPIPFHSLTMKAFSTLVAGALVLAVQVLAYEAPQELVIGKADTQAHANTRARIYTVSISSVIRIVLQLLSRPSPLCPCIHIILSNCSSLLC
jgi:hypothetical protein